MKNTKRAAFIDNGNQPLVIVGDNETLESAIKRFKKKVDDEGILKTWKENQYFQKPSAKKREKMKESLRKEAIRKSSLDKKLSYRDSTK